MLKKTYSLIIILIFILSTTTVYAAGTNINTIVDKTSYSLVHDESEVVQFNVENANTFCSVSCDWDVTSTLSGQSTSGSLSLFGAGITKSDSFTITAPSKGVNSATYTLTVNCRESGSLFCPDDNYDMNRMHDVGNQ